MLRTVPVDPSLVRDPSLIIYEGMLELPGIYLVSNGDQTRTIYEALRLGGTFDGALATREREPDPPNYTPRISAMLDLRLRAPSSHSACSRPTRSTPSTPTATPIVPRRRRPAWALA